MMLALTGALAPASSMPAEPVEAAVVADPTGNVLNVNVKDGERLKPPKPANEFQRCKPEALAPPRLSH
ncbi:MAG: hypothetical protein WBA51_00345 [Erythrobacter sp.]